MKVEEASQYSKEACGSCRPMASRGTHSHSSAVRPASISLDCAPAACVVQLDCRGEQGLRARAHVGALWLRNMMLHALPDTAATQRSHAWEACMLSHCVAICPH